MSKIELSEYTGIVDHTVELVRRIFQEVRNTRKLPLAKVRNDVVPVVLNLAEKGSMLSTFIALEDTDDYTYRHSVAVGVISCLLGAWLQLGRQEQLQLTTAAILHDIGKMAVPEYILDKPDQLVDEELKTMKNHTVYGYALLKETFGINHRQAIVALQHHERLDGSGYPLGVAGEKIDAFSRIVAVADVFHAMISDKVYRGGMSIYDALCQMNARAVTGLDPLIVSVFTHKVMDAMIGYAVSLSDGRTGRIVMIQQQDLTRPLVQTDDEFVDLIRSPSIHITDFAFEDAETDEDDNQDEDLLT